MKSDGGARSGDERCKHRQFRRFGDSDTPLFKSKDFILLIMMMLLQLSDVIPLHNFIMQLSPGTS